MKIGLTGGTGFIGRYLLRDYCDQYNFVVATSNFAKVQESIAQIQFVQSDYSYESFCKIFSGCNAIVHLGASVPNTVRNIELFADYQRNIVVSENLFRAAVALGIRHIVNISSVSVYNKENGTVCQESEVCEPDNMYGITKLAIEHMAGLYVRKSLLCVVNLRVSQVLGYRKYQNAGLYAMMLENSIAGNPLIIYGSGSSSRDYIYVKDVASAIDYALRYDGSGTFNISMGTATSNLELAKAYCQAFHNEGGIVHVPVEVEDMCHWCVDVSKARRTLGFSAQYDLAHMTEDIYAEWKSSLADDIGGRKY